MRHLLFLCLFMLVMPGAAPTQHAERYNEYNRIETVEQKAIQVIHDAEVYDANRPQRKAEWRVSDPRTKAVPSADNQQP